MLHAWKAGPQTVALRQQLEAMPRRRRLRALDPGRALPLPARPLRARLPGRLRTSSAHKPKSKVLILDAQPRRHLQGGAVQEGLDRGSTRASSSTGRNHGSTGVDVRRMTAKFEIADDVKADVLNVVPPQRAGDIAADAG